MKSHSKTHYLKQIKNRAALGSSTSRAAAHPPVFPIASSDVSLKQFYKSWKITTADFLGKLERNKWDSPRSHPANQSTAHSSVSTMPSYLLVLLCAHTYVCMYKTEIHPLETTIKVSSYSIMETFQECLPNTINYKNNTSRERFLKGREKYKFYSPLRAC